MKEIIEIIVVFAFFAADAFAAESVAIYQGPQGDALILSVASRQIIELVGGTQGHGSITVPDCFVKAEIRLHRKPNYFEGEFSPVRNELNDLTADEVKGKGLGVFIHRDSIRVGGAETSDICADGANFSGTYKRIENEAPKFKSLLIQFLRLTDQMSRNLIVLTSTKKRERNSDCFHVKQRKADFQIRTRSN